MNRKWYQQQRKANAKPLPEPTAVAACIAHPHRALEPGKQWVSHERAGSKSAQRRKRQMMAQQLKQLRKQHGGSTSISGVDEHGGLILDFPQPARANINT